MLSYLTNVLSPGGRVPGLVLHVGAGRASELKHYLEANFERIVLVEAYPESVTRLRRETRAHPNVEVYSALVDIDQSGCADFQVYNAPRYSSTLAPGKVTDFLPNLAIDQVVSVETISLSDLIELQPLSSDRVNLLVIETLGIEAEILRSVPQELLAIFELVAVCSSPEVIYEGGGCADELCSVMISKGFELQFRELAAKPFTEMLFRYNRLAQEGNTRLAESVAIYERTQQELTAEIHNFKDAHLVLEAERNELRSSVAIYERTQQELTAEIHNFKDAHLVLEAERNELRSSVAIYERTQQELTAEIHDFKDAHLVLEAERNELRSSVAIYERTQQELTAEIHDFKEAHLVLEAERNDLRSRITELTQLCDEHTHLVEQSSNHSTEMEKALAASSDEIARLTSQFRDAGKSNALMSKLLTKAQLDNESLRISHREELEKNKDLVELIGSLRDKLEQASLYYFELQRQHPELVDDLTPGEK